MFDPKSLAAQLCVLQDLPTANFIRTFTFELVSRARAISSEIMMKDGLRLLCFD